MSEHTPGPWRISDQNPESVVTSVGDFYWLTWGHLPHQHEQYGINPQADARLIAAAPDLLEALQAEERHQWARRNLEAISDPLDARILGLRIERERAESEASRLRRSAIAKATGKEAP